ncbi:MAG: diguanylate cyclase/phosphodiesterase with and Chase sensor(s) [Proteobacteria bacterium]|nr:diguanylate cyclase/phosphodiesterase with and Chase sensor(s) [Pseudomonadota bacterium]
MLLLRSLWLPIGILLLTLGLTWQAWHHERSVSQLQLKTHFNHALQETIGRIEQRMGAYEQLLRGVQAHYVAAGHIDRNAFRDYVATLQLDANFSGVQAIGHVDWVPAAQLESHLAKMRRLGFADYRISPDGAREAYAPIVQREPYIGRNRTGYGFDTWSEPVRHEALERSRDSGMARVSGKVRLRVETEPSEQPGFVMYLPLYASDAELATPEQRRAKLIGWVYASFRMSDLMASLYGQNPPGISFSIHDGIELSPQTLMYQSEQQTDNASGIFNVHEYLVVAGRTWTLSMTATPDFARHFGNNEAPLIVWSGIGLSLLLTLVAWLLTTSRARALKLAQTMTRELQASERFRLDVTDNIPGLVAYWNADLHCEFANARHQEFFGKAPEEVRGMPMKALVGEERFTQAEPHIRAVLQGEAQTFEGTQRMPDGSIRSTYTHYLPDVLGEQIKGFYALVSDITPLKVLERHLRHFESIIQSSEDAIFSQSLDGVVSSWNPGAVALFGFTADEMIGHSLQRIFPDDRLDDEVEILERIQQGEEIDHFETVRLRKDGARITVSVTISPILDADGNIAGVSTIARDITAQKQAEAELANYQEHLEALVEQRTAALSVAKENAEAANRAKSIFLATMSHELRTPMNAIIGLTGIVRRSTTAPRQADQLDKVLAASNQLLEIINDILELSHIEASDISLAHAEFRLADTFDRVVARFEPDAKKKDLEFEVEVAPGLAQRQLQGDPTRLAQILGKLTSNAIKFTAAGSVHIRAFVSEESAGSLVLRCEVADTGIGIPAEQQGRLFAAFEQLDGSMTRKFGGTGLGLAISKKLVLAMGGSIGLESQIGKGSTFWFTVRLDKSGAPEGHSLQS